MKTLILPLKKKYFDEIKNGTKQFEYRLTTDYWKKRLTNRVYDKVVFTLGYPNKDDKEKRIEASYIGYERQTITHEHFGKDPVEVFAIYTPNYHIDF